MNMSTWKVSITLFILLIAICLTVTSQDVKVYNRPRRPDAFENVEEVNKYLDQVKLYIQSSNRYGKRFAPTMKIKKQRMPINWRSIYQMLDNNGSM